jgi:DNA-binding response OmpR family regulator
MDERIPLIVFADRDLEWSQSLRKQLRERGLKVSEANSSRKLVDLVRQTPPDLVVLGDSLDELGGRLLAGLIQERSPGTRIIRVIGSRDRDPAEPGPADNVLCTTTRRASSWQLAATIERVLTCAPRGTQRSKAPLVICVDDDAVFLKSLARVIRRQGYRVLTYEDPELALEELPLLRPDLLILDVLMPGLSGFEVLDEIRRYYRGTLPVVLLSALDTDEKIDEGKRHGAASYLVKPCVPEILLDVVRRLVRRSEEAGEEKVPGWTARRVPGRLDPSGESSGS